MKKVDPVMKKVFAMVNKVQAVMPCPTAGRKKVFVFMKRTSAVLPGRKKFFVMMQRVVSMMQRASASMQRVFASMLRLLQIYFWQLC